MAKRFTDTSKLKKPFMRTLSRAYKLLWVFICDDCDNSGIWMVDMKAAKLYLGGSYKEDEALALFNADEVRVVPIDRGKKWFLPGFVEFQYGQLTPACKPHLPVIAALKKWNLLDDELKLSFESKGYQKGIQRVSHTLEDKDKDKEQEKDKDKEGGVGGFDQPDVPGDDLIYPVESEDFRSWWAKWKEYRLKAHGKRYPMYGEQAALDQLRGANIDPVATVRKAIESNWLNLYPESKPANGQAVRKKTFDIDKV